CNEEGNCVYIAAPAISLDVPEDKTTDEKGKSLSLALHLNNAPGNDVRVGCEILTTSPNKEVEVSCNEIVFNADNWQLEQTIKVTGVDDYLIDGDQTYTIKVTTTSEDKDFDALVAESAVLTNLDTTKPGFVVSETSLMTYEDQTAEPAKFTVALISQPAADVTVKIHSSKEEEGTVSPTSLTFTKDNWNEPQTVTVKGVDDEIDDGNVNYSVYFEPAESEDKAYQDVQAPPVNVTNVDNDVAGMSMNLANDGFELDEGQTQNLTIKLNTKPKNDVKIALTVDDDTEASSDVAEVTVKAEDWNKGTEVQLIGVADHIIDGDQPVKLTFTATSDDKEYNFDSVYTGTVKDTDTADLVISTIGSPIVKEGSDDAVTLSLSLTSKPTADVTVDIAIGDDTEIKTDKTTITITPDNWNVLQDVKVSSVDDDVIDGDVKSKVTLKLTSEDTHFAGVSKEVEFTTLDDDEAGFVVTSTPGSYAEDSGATASMTVALKAQPEDDVTVTVSSSDATELAVTSASTLTFTKENWKTPQTVTVIVVDDNNPDGSQTAYVMFAGSSSDPKFNEIKDQSATFTIIDNESATVALAADPQTIGPDTTISMATLSLGAEPLSDVTLTLKAEHTAIVTFDPPTLTFTKSNWNMPQYVTVYVNLNAITSASAVENIWATASGDIAYTGVESKPVALKLYKMPRVTDFEFTGSVQTIDLPIGTYKLEVWGAQGGQGKSSSVIHHGAKGGYSKGTVNLTQPTKLYVYVGGTGEEISGKSCVGGGFNGGGNASGQQASWTCGGGGGASDIRIATDSLYSRLIVAGGGGGWCGGHVTSDGDNTGVGGGATGGKGVTVTTDGGTGGTQITGGNGKNYPVSSTTCLVVTAGGFGFGGNVTLNNCSDGGAGGGGGWYGGGAAGWSGSGGGSGWIYTAKTYTTWHSGNATDANKYTLNSSYYLTSSQTIAGSSTMPAPIGGTETGHPGNGFVRITVQ
ncbi:MAG: hypothetical protein IJU23_00435, partial [Proteobacteria bacterium]|nr:hypothetical protein [Pseudomonadota bacterium]